MMNILITAPTGDEMSLFIEYLQRYSTEEERWKNRLLFHLSGHRIFTCITGAGMVNTAIGLSGLLAKEKIHFALQTGIAGSFNRSLKIGDVVHVVSDCLAEMGAEDDGRFIPATELGIMTRSKIFIKNKNRFSNQALNKLQKVNGITVNTVHGNEESICRVRKKFRPDVETMEGAAFLFACRTFRIKCAQIRAISNYVEKRDVSRWNIPLAIEKLKTKTVEILRGF